MRFRKQHSFFVLILFLVLLWSRQRRKKFLEPLENYKMVLSKGENVKNSEAFVGVKKLKELDLIF